MSKDAICSSLEDAIRTPALLFSNRSRRSVFSSNDRFDFRVRNGSGSLPFAMAG